MKSNAKKDETRTHKSVYIVFISLLLDLLAFTIILPLFPSLLEHYRLNDQWGLYSWLSKQINFFQNFLGVPDKYNSILFGGLLGSMFSFLQFLVSPIVGGLSDVLGRKLLMIICLTGISISYILWAISTNLTYFFIARFIGGISKGNVSLSMAIITDVSNAKNRGKGMALVGIAFSLGFIVGPMIGAGFSGWAKNRTDTWFTVPALFAFSLAFIDLLFFTIYFEESLPKNKRTKSLENSLKNVKTFICVSDLFKFSAIKNFENNEQEEEERQQQQQQQLRQLGLIYFVYLFVYSGLEFTLTFLTHHVFHYTSMQQGWMFFLIGLIMAIIQGNYVRKISITKTKSSAILGLWLIIPSFLLIALASAYVSFTFLYIGLFLFAVSTAFVVPCLTTMASQYGSLQQKGTVMGIFRSLGALARALGPIVASIFFWSIGSYYTYSIGALALLWPVIHLRNFKYVL